MDLILPFEIGDFAESKSYLDGFRGAWFRCKVFCMRVSKGCLEYYLEYMDYPDEEKEWTKVFEHNPACCKEESCLSRQIMLRPPFPQWYQRDKIPESFPNSDVIESVCDTWKLGDLVDWFCDNCYWTGKITRLLSEDEVKIQLFEPPIGEGRCYDAKCKDLRPALDWSLEKGWTVPLSQVDGKCWNAVRVIYRRSDTRNSSTDEEKPSDHNEKEVQKSRKGHLKHPMKLQSAQI